MNEEPGVWQRLRRRRVTRTSVTYVAVGFTLLEILKYVAPLLGLSDEVGRIALGSVVLGFPLAIVLAWRYDLTPKGIVRTPDDSPEEDGPTAPGGLSRSAWLLLCAVIVAIGFVLRVLRV